MSILWLRMLILNQILDMEMMSIKITQYELKKFIEVDGYRPISWRRASFSNHVLVCLKKPSRSCI